MQIADGEQAARWWREAGGGDCLSCAVRKHAQTNARDTVAADQYRSPCNHPSSHCGCKLEPDLSGVTFRAHRGRRNCACEQSSRQMFSTNGQSSRTAGPSGTKLPLPTFLKVLTGNGVPAAKAMAVTGKMSAKPSSCMSRHSEPARSSYKTYNTPGTLAELTDLKLKSAGVDDKEDRKLVLAAIRKAGYKSKPQRKPLSAETAEALAASGSGASASTPHADASLSVSAGNLPVSPVWRARRTI